MKGFKKNKVRNINWGNKGKIPPRMSGGGLPSVICTNLRRYFQNVDKTQFWQVYFHFNNRSRCHFFFYLLLLLMEGNVGVLWEPLKRGSGHVGGISGR